MKKPGKEKPKEHPQTIPLASLHLNPRNPRFIRDNRFAALVKSLKDFPAMMELRPIVVDKSMMILGGNMRFRAAQELGMKEIPALWVKVADKLTPEQARRFVVEDNLMFGETDWDILAADFEIAELIDIGWEEEELLDKDFKKTVLQEQVEEIRAKPMLRVLISVPIDRGGEVKPLIDAVLNVDGVEVIQGANG